MLKFKMDEATRQYEASAFPHTYSIVRDFTTRSLKWRVLYGVQRQVPSSASVTIGRAYYLTDAKQMAAKHHARTVGGVDQ